MTELIKDIRHFWSKKCFAVGIPLMMLLSYGTLLLNPTIGIDDTSFKLYYIDGVSPAMGRWCLYLINKIFPLNYNPFFVEAMGLLFFCLSISLWCVVFYRILGDKIPMTAYVIFGGVMLSSPIISEVVIWYVQDGIYLGYGVTALAVLAGMDTFRVLSEPALSGKKDRKSAAGKIGRLLLCGALLAVALGFYEAFMFVFLMAMLMNFMLLRVTDNPSYTVDIRKWLLNMVIICVSGMVFRTVAISGITAFFHLEEQAKVLASRNFSDILGGFLGWFDGSRSISEFTYVLKDFFVKYYLNAIVYLPIMVLVLAVLLMVLWSVKYTVKKKDGWILAAAAAILLLPWVLPILEGWATYYRSAQYVPLLTAFAVLLAAWELRDFCVKTDASAENALQGKALRRRRLVQGAALFAAFLLLYRQGYEMNKWLYVDAMKYEDEKRTMDSIALYLSENCDTTKPICVVGHHQTAPSLLKDVYCPTWSKKYTLIRFFVEGLSPEIFEKYNTPLGYAAAETPQLSTINWGTSAFYGTDRELIAFWKMHGFSFIEDGNQEHYVQARELMKDKPAWPAAGSIVETEENIIVNFGNFEKGA